MALTKATNRIIAGTPVNVLDYISGGTGTDGDPYTGWDTAVTWAADTEYKFPAGVFQYATTLSLSYTGIRVMGAGRATVLQFTGTGNCVSISDTSSNSVHIEGFHIKGNVNATNGIYTHNSHYGTCKDIIVSSVGTAAWRTLYGVYWSIENFHTGNNFGTQTILPARGIHLGGAGGGETVTSYNIVNPNIADCTAVGIHLDNGWGNTIVGGATEAMSDIGLHLDSNSHDNTIIGLYIESVTNTAAQIDGTANDLISLWCYGGTVPPIVFGGGAANQIFGGIYGDITIDAGVKYTSITGSRAGGTFTDNGISTTLNNAWSDAIVGYLTPAPLITGWTNHATNPYETLTSSGTDITSAINTTGQGIVNSNVMNLIKGATYLFQWNVTLNSGTLPNFGVTIFDTSAGVDISKVGNNMYAFVSTGGSYYLTLKNESGIASDFSVDQVTVTRIQ
jgi:hypothetical protein